tara:strand:+ start:1059 stop:1433 length:375 start_codon:yes stop_codon:yes gene_type:complete
MSEAAKASFEALVEKLDCLLYLHLRKRVKAHLGAVSHPVGVGELADTLRVPMHAVRRVLRDLDERREIAMVGFDVDGFRVFRPVSIGLCEWCGLVNHYLIDGECARCATAVRNQARPFHARRVC